MVNILTNSGSVAYGVKNFILDTPTDFAYVGTNHETGSTAFVISTSEKYMLNGQKQWVKIQVTTGGGSSGGGGEAPDPDNLYIYDGGVII